MTIELLDRTRGGRVDLDGVASELAALETLEDIFRWARASGTHDGTEDLVVQDEYTHDAIFPYRDELFLVFGLT